MEEMRDELCAALAACSDLSDGEVSLAGTRFRTVQQLSDHIQTLAMRVNLFSASRNETELGGLWETVQEVKQALLQSQSTRRQQHRSPEPLSNSRSRAQPAFGASAGVGSSAGTPGLPNQFIAMTTMREDLQKLSDATEWCVELMAVECQMAAGSSTSSSSSKLEHSQRYDSLCTQLDQISHIEEALNMLSSAHMDAAVQPNSDIWVAVERVNNRLLEIHSEMAREQKSGRQQSPQSQSQQQQVEDEGSAEWEQWDRLSLSDGRSSGNSSNPLQGSSFRKLSAVDDAERDLQLAIDESLAHALYEQDLREDEANEISRDREAMKREQLAQLAEQSRLQNALDAATSLAAQQQVRLQQQQQQQQQNRLAEQQRQQQAVNAAKVLAAQQQQEQRRKQQAVDAAKVLAAQQQLRQQQQQQQQQQAQLQARLAAADLQQKQLQSRLLQSQQQQSASPVTSDYNVYKPSRAGLPRAYAVGKCSDARYAELDRHAVCCPASYTTSVPKLVSYLSTVANTDEELARVLTRWVAENIRYDFDALRSGNYGAMDPESVLRSRSSVCDGYARLLVGLMTHAGMRAQRVCGCGKGISWEVDGRTPTKSNHAWVAAQIGGLVSDPGVIEPSNAPPKGSRPCSSQASWCLIEPCWAAGSAKSVGGRMEFDKKFKDEYFLTRPELFVLDHLPTEQEWQLLPPANIMTPSNYVTSQSRISSGWRAISHPLTDISLSAADFKRQPLRIRLEMSKLLETSGQSLKFRFSRAVARSGGTFVAGDLLASANGISGSSGSASSAFTLRVSHVAGSPPGLEYSVTCGSAAAVQTGNVFRIEAELGVQLGGGDTSGWYTPSTAAYTLRLT